MNDLKPCPFCGNTQIVVKNPYQLWGDPYIAYCTDCFCGAYVGPFATKQEAINTWNRRVALDD